MVTYFIPISTYIIPNCYWRRSYSFWLTFLQVLQKQSQPERHRSNRNNSHFFVPQMLVLIFKFLSCCVDASTRGKILTDLLDLIDSNPSNTEALMV